MLTAAEKIAVSSAIDSKTKKTARNELEPGKYEIDALVRVFGTLTVGEDFERNNTASMPQTKMLLAALMLNGTSVKAFVRRYLDGEFEVSTEQEKELKAVWDELASNFRSTFKGAVTNKLTVEKIESAVENAA